MNTNPENKADEVGQDTAEAILRGMADMLVKVGDRKEAIFRDMMRAAHLMALYQLATGKPHHLVIKPVIKDGMIVGFNQEEVGDSEGMALELGDLWNAVRVTMMDSFVRDANSGPAAFMKHLIGRMKADGIISAEGCGDPDCENCNPKPKKVH